MEPTTVDTVFCLPLNVPVYTVSYFGYTWGLYRRGEAVMYVTRASARCSRGSTAGGDGNRSLNLPFA